MKMILSAKLASALVAVGVGMGSAQAAFIPLGNTNYFQNFNTLPSSGKSSTLPLGWAISYPTDKGTEVFADDGSGMAGRIYSYGNAGSGDRALGSLRDYTLNGSMSPMFGANFQNTSGSTMNRLNISYTGEEWHLGAQGRGPDKLQFQYSLNAGSLTDSHATWLNAPALDFFTPNLTGVGAHDGTLAANQTHLASSIGFLNIPAGGTFWVRWVDVALPGGGPEDGLAVDNFSISAVPEAQTLAAGGGMTLLLSFVFWKRGGRKSANVPAPDLA
jgi:hypothetical protein